VIAQRSALNIELAFSLGAELRPHAPEPVLSPSKGSMAAQSRACATPQHQPKRFPSPPSPLTLFDRTRLNREKRRTRIAQDARKRVGEG
jgi:hypothetical protein